MLLIDKLSNKPVYEQVVDGIKRGILLGIYPPGVHLPSVREQSILLSINPNTIQKAYTELSRCGIILPSPGNGCFVSSNAKAILYEEAKIRLSSLNEALQELCIAGIQREEILSLVDDIYQKDVKQTFPKK